MNLLNKTLRYISISIIIIVTIWSGVLYWALLDEIYDSIDDGLANYKLLIIHEASTNSSILNKTSFGESNYAIHPISESVAIEFNDRYVDTMMYMVYEDDLEPVRKLSTAFEQEGLYYQLDVIASMVEEDDLIENLFWFVLGLFIVLILSFVFINAFWHKRIWQPFYQLLDRLRLVRVDKDTTLPEMKTDIREFKDLETSLAFLLDRFHKTFQSQKQFTENAAHELQTPIAIITSKIELLLDQESLNPDQASKLNSMYDMLQRMNQLNKGLLTLAKIENHQIKNVNEVDLGKIVEELMVRFEDQMNYKEIKYKLTCEDPIFWKIEESHATMMIQNLLLNAIKYTPISGRIYIIISPETFTIENTAIDDALDAEQIFDRFYKQTDQQNATGLGLSIVKAIATLHNYHLSYQFLPKGFHQFNISLG